MKKLFLFNFFLCSFFLLLDYVSVLAAAWANTHTIGMGVGIVCGLFYMFIYPAIFLVVFGSVSLSFVLAFDEKNIKYLLPNLLFIVVIILYAFNVFPESIFMETIREYSK